MVVTAFRLGRVFTMSSPRGSLNSRRYYLLFFDHLCRGWRHPVPGSVGLLAFGSSILYMFEEPPGFLPNLQVISDSLGIRPNHRYLWTTDPPTVHFPQMAGPSWPPGSASPDLEFRSRWSYYPHLPVRSLLLSG